MPGKRFKFLLLLAAFSILLLYMLGEEYSGTGESMKSVNFLDIENDNDNLAGVNKYRNITVHTEQLSNRKLAKDDKILLVFWTPFFGSKPRLGDGNQYKWPFFYVGNRCPVKCELTTQQHRISQASAIVFHARDFDVADVPPWKFHKLPWILHTHENPVYTPVLQDAKIMSKFNFLLSYRLDSDFPCPEFVKPRLDLPLPFENKTRLVLAVYSNCEGLRTHYMGELRKYIKVDFYGRCLQTHKFLKRTADQNDSKLMSLLCTYKFTLVFPNADCDYYVTEKMYNALSSGTVPVWLGTNKIDEILKWGNLKQSVIKVKDFSSPEKLANYLHYLANNKHEYNKYLKWKYKGFNFPPEYYSSPIGQWWEGFPIYCRVCMRIAKDPKGHDGLPKETCSMKSSERLAKLITS